MMDQRTRDEFNRALVLADAIDRLCKASNTNWGVESVALAQALASAVFQAQPGNPAGSRRMINEVLALARGLMVDLHNKALGENTIAHLRALLDLGTVHRNWAVDPISQAIITNEMANIVDRKPVLDVIAACQTLMANLVCDNADTAEDALAGLEACMGDMRTVVAQRYTPDELRNAPPAGTA